MPDKHAKTIARIQARLARLSAPVRHTARNEFCRQLILGTVGGMRRTVEKRALARSGIAAHNTKYDALSAAEQRHFHRSAKKARKAKESDRSRAVSASWAEMHAENEKAARERDLQVGVCNQVASFRLSDPECVP